MHFSSIDCAIIIIISVLYDQWGEAQVSSLAMSIQPNQIGSQQLFVLCNDDGLHVGNLFNNTLGSKFCSNLLWKGEEGQGEKRIDSFHNGSILKNISYACTQFTTAQCMNLGTLISQWCYLNMRLFSLCILRSPIFDYHRIIFHMHDT